MKRIKNIFSLFILVFLIPFIIWNITFQFYIALPLIAIYAGGIYLFKKRRKHRIIYSSVLIGFSMYILALPITLNQMANTQRSYITYVSSGKGLNIIEKFNIYGLNIMAVSIALPLFQEVAIEAGYMMFNYDGADLVLESDFFLESRRIQKAISSGNKKGRVRWYKKDYHNSEARVSLALNICNYEILENGKMKVWAEMNYPKKNEIIIGKEYLKVVVDEGLFRYLVDEGWLFAYRTVWISKSKVI